VTAFLAIGGVLLDQLLGEPRRGHPLVFFGHLAQLLERRMNRGRRIDGVLALGILLLPPVALAGLLVHRFGFWIELPLLYFVLGARSLTEHAQAVAQALLQGDLSLARQRVGWMVSRDTADMDADAVSRATIESVLENGNDAIFAALFWFFLTGGTGALAYRLLNTLDAMWGYRTERFAAFGWSAARLDDLVNWLPARCTALSYALAGNRSMALQCWRRQAHLLASPNGGVVMTAGAGALGVELGGDARYHGRLQHKPRFGTGPAPGGKDIGRALDLVRRSLLIWLGLFLLLELSCA